MTLEHLAAGLALLVCLALLLHMVLGPARRQQVRAWLRSRLQWRRRRDLARREAGEAIERARRAAGEGRWQGNVYHPDSFDARRSKRPPRH
jgi:hypothetical protein